MIKKILDAIKESQHVLLAAHENPDGDAIGSLVGMAHICIALKVPYTILMEQVPKEYDFLIGNVSLSHVFNAAYDTFVALDCGDTKRLGEARAYFEKAKTTINIDHHETNDDFGKLNYVQKHASSTSELVFNIIEQGDIKLTEESAAALYAGIVTDTGGFMHSCTQPSTHIAVSKILQTPFDFSTIYYRLIHQKTEKTILLQAVATHHLTKLCHEKVFLSYITHKDLEEHAATREDASSIVSHLKNIKGCEIAALIYPAREQNTYKLSLRCNAPYNVAEIAAAFGGGGHVRAAGATIEGKLDEVIDKVVQSLSFLESN